MLFTDPIFLPFFAFVFATRWLLRRYSHQKLFLILANAVFYGAWDYRFLFLMGGYIVVNHAIAVRIHAAQAPELRKRWLVACVVANLTILGFFKYFNFFVSSGASLLGELGMRTETATLEIILPVGISFITFQAMSYVIDVYRRELPPARFVDFALYKSFSHSWSPVRSCEPPTSYLSSRLSRACATSTLGSASDSSSPATSRRRASPTTSLA